MRQGFTHVHAIGSAEAIRRFAAGAGRTVRRRLPELSADTGAAAAADGRASIDGCAVPRPRQPAGAQSLHPRRLERPPRRGARCAACRSCARPAARLPTAAGLLSVEAAQVDALGRSGSRDHPRPVRAQPLAQLLAAGAQVSFCHSQSSPWAGVRNAVVGDNGIGARAAFNAATRFAHRAAGNPEDGVLAPGRRCGHRPLEGRTPRRPGRRPPCRSVEHGPAVGHTRAAGAGTRMWHFPTSHSELAASRSGTSAPRVPLSEGCRRPVDTPRKGNFS
jgi:hypothetical protein